MIPDLNLKSTGRWIGHGRPGELCLDGQKLNPETLNDQGLRERLRAKVRGFTSLELISCHVAAGPGRDFVRRLADMLGIRVYASSRAVGPAHLGGTYLLDFGYCPDSGCDLPGYEAAPVPGLNHLMPILTVPFENGYVGQRGANNQKADGINTFATMGIDRAYFSQNSSSDRFQTSSQLGLAQGNDVPGNLIIEIQGETFTIPGYIGWQDKLGGKSQSFGFLPADNLSLNPEHSTKGQDPDYDPQFREYAQNNSFTTDEWIVYGEYAASYITNTGLILLGADPQHVTDEYYDSNEVGGSADLKDVLNQLNAYLR